MTLRQWINKHFFDSPNPYHIVNEDGKKLKTDPDLFDKYEFVRTETIDGEDFITVRES